MIVPHLEALRRASERAMLHMNGDPDLVVTLVCDTHGVGVRAKLPSKNGRWCESTYFIPYNQLAEIKTPVQVLEDLVDEQVKKVRQL